MVSFDHPDQPFKLTKFQFVCSSWLAFMAPWFDWFLSLLFLFNLMNWSWFSTSENSTGFHPKCKYYFCILCTFPHLLYNEEKPWKQWQLNWWGILLWRPYPRNSSEIAFHLDNSSDEKWITIPVKWRDNTLNMAGVRWVWLIMSVPAIVRLGKQNVDLTQIDTLLLYILRPHRLVWHDKRELSYLCD